MLGACAVGKLLVSKLVAGVRRHDLAQQLRTRHWLVALNEWVPAPDSLATYAATFLGCRARR